MTATPEELNHKAFKKSKNRLNQSKGVGVKSKGTSVAPRNVPAIELYQRENCPFSHRVRSRLSDLGLDFIAHTVADNDLKHQQLVQAGGKDQIPFMVDHSTGTKLYESSAILAYLDHQYGGEKATQGAFQKLARSVSERIEGRADQIAWVLKRPMDQATRVRRDLGDAVETVRGSWRMLKSAMENLSSRARSSQPETGSPEASTSTSA